MVEKLGGAVTFYKIGYQLAFAGGLSFVDGLIRAGKRVFLDMKLHDIENTVAKGVESVAGLGVTFLTVHAYPQTMKAAVAARQGSGLKVLAVTVLTSYDDIDLAESGLRDQCRSAGRAPCAASAGHWHRRARVFAGRSLAAAPRGRQPDGVRHARRAPGRQCARRSETRRDAGTGNRRGRRLSGCRPADHRPRAIRRRPRKRSSPKSPSCEITSREEHGCPRGIGSGAST